MLLRQETQLAVPTREQGSINTGARGSAIQGSTSRSINQRWHQPLKQRRGAQSNDESYQSRQSITSNHNQLLHSRSINCCSIQTKPPLIWLSDLHKTQQVRASRRS